MYMDLYRNYGTVQESQFHTLFITFIIFLTITNINIIIINIINIIIILEYFVILFTNNKYVPS